MWRTGNIRDRARRGVECPPHEESKSQVGKIILTREEISLPRTTTVDGAQGMVQKMRVGGKKLKRDTPIVSLLDLFLH